MADDVGLSVGAADHSLKTVLSSLKVNADDSRLWDLLPFAYGAVLTCNGWKKADTSLCFAGAACQSVALSLWLQHKIISSSGLRPSNV